MEDGSLVCVSILCVVSVYSIGVCVSVWLLMCVCWCIDGYVLLL